MAKMKPEKAQQTRRTCGVRGCTGNLNHGNGLGCDVPDCSNFYKKWSGYRGGKMVVMAEGPVTVKTTPFIAEPEDDRAAMLAAIAARRKKEKKAGKGVRLWKN